MKIEYAAASDVGRVRQRNEDSFLLSPDLGIFAVADGMGGHAAGDVASRIAVDSLREFVARSSRKDHFSPANLLEKAFHLANQNIHKSSEKNREYRGMGTTLVAVFLTDQSATAANVGDSRLYQVRGEQIWQVTEDHSFAWEQYKQGFIAREDIPSFPLKNIVTRALGLQAAVEVDIRELQFAPADFFLLCSDGLSDVVKDEELLREIRKGAAHLQRSCDRLVHLANSRGGKDNSTVVLIHIA